MNTIVVVSDDANDLLLQARDRARRLLHELESRQTEMNANPPENLPPCELEAGQSALRNAVDSARRTLEALEAATDRVEPGSGE